MTGRHRTTVTIASVASRASTLSKGQKTFNDLVERIGKQRARLAGWEAAIPKYQQKYTTDLLPELNRLGDLQAELVRALDRWSCDTGLNRNELRLIDEVIVDVAGPLLFERDDPELRAILESHGDVTVEPSDAGSAEDQEAMEAMKSMVEDAFGIEAGTLDEVVEDAEEELMQKSRQREAEQEAHAAARAQKKSPKQRALEARRDEDARRVSQSIRDVYRRLASLLHPDRETDPDERKRKTALMQRVNDAYARNNLLQMLELQLELEHIDQAALDNISEERLQHYNTVLKQQLAELATEIRRVEMDFRARFDLPPGAAVSPKSILRELASYLSAVRHEIDRYAADVRACADVKGLRQFLARTRQDRKAAAMRF